MKKIYTQPSIEMLSMLTNVIMVSGGDVNYGEDNVVGYGPLANAGK